MASFNKFQPFVANIANKVYNLGSDQLKVALCATANTPVNTYNQLSNLTEISYTNLSSRNITTTSCVQTSGVLKLILADLTLTASGTVAAFQYVVIYDDTATNKELIGWYDMGVAITLATSSALLLDFDQTNGLLQIT
jgi:hypothetical protein